jgi:molybdopterin/thiamine biosynthesis adenylyltransferase
MIDQNILEHLMGFRVSTTEIEPLRKMSEEIVNEGGFLEKISENVGENFENEIKNSYFFEDLKWFAQEFLTASSKPQNADLWWLLMISRCFGLIEFSRLRKLRKMKIRVLGASVAAATVELLASLGGEDIVCIDPGVLEASNLPRLPMGSAAQLGKCKSEALIERLFQINPYGKFTALTGKVVCFIEEKKTAKDLTVSEFIQDADLIIEVVDDIRVKAFTHLHALKTKPMTPLIFIADVGNSPIVKVIKADHHGKVDHPFGNTYTKKELGYFEDIIRIQQFPENERVKVFQRAAYLMVKDELPVEHTAQFLLNCIGIIPFWSQTSVATRMSASLAAVQILQEIDQSRKIAELQNPENIFQACQKYLQL